MLPPNAAQMLAAADSSVALARLRAFTRWVRAGRALTREGRLLLSDARAVADALDLDHFSRDRARTSDEMPEITLLMAWARQARLVRVQRGRLMQVRTSAALLSRPIELWRRAFEAVGGIGEHFGGSNVFGAPSLFGMSLGEAFPILLHHLYAAGGDPIPVELFHRIVRDTVNERMGCVVDDLAGDVEHRLWRRDVTALLDALELLGAVHLSESLDGENHEELIALAGRDDPDPTLVALTPIGIWAVQEMLTEQGVHAPLVGELAEEDIEYVCVRMSGVRSEVAEAELTAWVRRPQRTRRGAGDHALPASGWRTRGTARSRSSPSPAPVRRGARWRDGGPARVWRCAPRQRSAAARGVRRTGPPSLTGHRPFPGSRSPGSPLTGERSPWPSHQPRPVRVLGRARPVAVHGVGEVSRGPVRPLPALVRGAQALGGYPPAAAGAAAGPRFRPGSRPGSRPHPGHRAAPAPPPDGGRRPRRRRAVAVAALVGPGTSVAGLTPARRSARGRGCPAAACTISPARP